jgi:type III secretory pathway component EscV
MARTSAIVWLSIGLTAFVLLLLFGFAAWVFLPIMPAAIIFVIAVLNVRQKAKTTKRTEDSSDLRKAA